MCPRSMFALVPSEFIMLILHVKYVRTTRQGQDNCDPFPQRTGEMMTEGNEKALYELMEMIGKHGKNNDDGSCLTGLYND